MNDVLSAITPPTMLGRILGVDDDALARFLLAENLRQSGYVAEMAASAAEAQRLLASRPRGHYDCLITDFQMPGQTGLDLLVWLRTFDPSLATIMIAGAGEKDLVAATLRSGASDYLDKPYRREDLQAAVRQAVAATRRNRDLAQTEAEAAALGMAQRRLLGGRTGQLHPRVRSCHHPRRGAGGDFLTVFELPGGELVVLAADVSGHDLKAAYVSAYFQGIVRGMLEKGTPVVEILGFFNRCLLQEWSDRSTSDWEVPTSLAVCAAVFHPAFRSATLFVSGFPDPHLLDTFGLVRPCGVGGGHPMGWFPDSIPQSVEIPLPRDGSLVLWTDGLEEQASNLGVSPWSLAYSLLDSERGPADAKRMSRAPDDVLVAVVATGEGVIADGFPLLVDRYTGDSERDIDHYQERWLRSLRLALHDVAEDRLAEIILTMREGVLNALIHGCRRRREEAASVRVHYCRRDHLVRILIEDPGEGHTFDWRLHEERAGCDLIAGHRGLGLIHRFATHVYSEREGASLILDFALS